MIKKTASILVSALLMATPTQAQTIDWVSSSAAEHWKAMPAISTKPIDNPPTILINDDESLQTIDGFGGSFNELGWVALSKATPEKQQEVIQALFGDDGAAFALARIPIGASDFALDGYSLAMEPEDYDLEHFSIDRDRQHLLPYIKAAMAVNPDLSMWASPWSPPAWMKNNNSYSKGSLRDEPKIKATYAEYFSKWIDAYKAEGVNLYAIAPQNEPNILNVYPTTLWSHELLSDFIGNYLGPKLAKDHPELELWLGLNGDPFNGGANPNDRLISVMNSKAAEYIDGIGFQYDSRNQIALAHELFPDVKLMQSESMCFNGENSWAQAMELFRLMNRYISGGASAYYNWNMILNETGNSTWDWPQNALITVDQNSGKVTYNGEFYVFKHFSHYVKPGATRLRSTGIWDDNIAFKNPDGSIVAIVANSSEQPHTASIAVGVDSDESFTVEVPGLSVNTFVIKD